MATRVRGTKWHREEWKGREDELETREQFENRRGLEVDTLNSRFYDYADQRPEVVKEEGRTLFYVKSELDEFYDQISNRLRPRTTAERMKSTIFRYQMTVKEHEKRVEETEKLLAKRRRELEAKKSKLAKMQKHYEIEVSTAD